MNNKKPITAVVLILSLIMSLGMAGCNSNNDDPAERDPEHRLFSSTASSDTVIMPSHPDQPSNTKETTEPEQSAQKQTSKPAEQSSQASKSESSQKPKKKNEAELKQLLAKNKPGKALYDAIYKLDDYKAGGHVVTDLDGDGNYELVIRSKDRTTISIYQVENKTLKGPVEIKAPTQADLRYGFFSEDKKYCDNICCLTTLEDMGGNTYIMNVYDYKGIDAEPEMSRSIVFTASYVADDPSKVQFTADDPGFLKDSWQESFNDECKTIFSIKETDKKPDVKKTEKILTEFTKKYYQKDDLTLRLYDGRTLGDSILPINSVSDLAKNAVFAKHGMKFEHPLCIAFFNKKDDYTEKKPFGKYTVEDYKDEKDLTDTDKMVLEAIIDFDNSL